MEFRYENIEKTCSYKILYQEKTAREKSSEVEREQNRYKISLSEHTEECLKEKKNYTLNGRVQKIMTTQQSTDRKQGCKKMGCTRKK